MFKKLFYLTCTLILVLALAGCEIQTPSTRGDIERQMAVSDSMVSLQKTPSDIDYSLERYNLIKRAYWVNGQREKANSMICKITKPLGYIVLFTESGNSIASFVVDGKVTSLNSYLSPDSEYYEGSSYYRNHWLADVDGSYGENDNGIFFFTVDGKYVEWSGIYLYSDIPFDVKDTIINYGE